MKRLSFVLILLLLMLALPFASACVTVQLSKSSYLAGETLQAEITGNLTQKIESSNLFLYKNKTGVVTQFSVQQLASNKFFVYSELPNSFGAHTFTLKNIFCVENNVLKQKTLEYNFTISKPITLAYDSLSAKVSNLQALSNEEIASLLFALAHTGKSAELKGELIKRIKNNCYGAAECNVKETALALIALKSASSNATETKEWLLNSQNSVDKGLWNLIITSSTATNCSLSTNQQKKTLSVLSGTNTFDLDLPDSATINLAIDCANVNAKAINTYLGIVYEFPFSQKDNSLQLSLNNARCWGNAFRSECNSESTAYALLALDNSGISDTKAENWLVENAQTAEEKAIVYLLTKNANIKSWLVNNQATQGYWSNSALAVSSEPSIKATALASYSLKDESLVLDKAKSWLLGKYSSSANNLFGTVQETSFVLYFVFPKEKIEPLLAVNPAAIRTRAETNFTLELKNKGSSAINAEINTGEGAGTEAVIEPLKIFSFVSSMPNVDETAFSSIDVVYTSEFSDEKYAYKIPVIVLPKKVTKIDEEIENTIAEQEQSLIQPDISFEQEEIKKDFVSGEESQIKITLKNPSDKTLSDVIITYSSELYGIIKSIEPSKIDSLASGESKEIIVTLNTKDSFGSYSGTIDAKSEGIITSLPVYFSAVSEQQIEEKTCIELNGKICLPQEQCNGSAVISSDTSLCCLGTCGPKTEAVGKKTNKWLIFGIVLLAVAFIAVVIFFYSRLAGKKQEQKDVLSKIEEKYSEHYSEKKNY